MTDALYLIEQFDPKENFRWCSCNDQWTRRNVIEGIYDGVLDCVSEIREIRDDGTWIYVTFEIAEDVETHGVQNNGGRFSYKALTFLHANGLRQLQMED